MSFILDALRKSEHERQRQSRPDVAHLQTMAPPRRFPPWAMAIAALLLVNLAVIATLLLRGEREPAPPSVSPPTTAVQPAAPSRSEPATIPIAAVPAVSEHNPIPPAESQALRRQAPIPVPARPDPETIEPDLNAANNTPLPTIHDLSSQSPNALPSMHLDIHVFDPRPAERFVFINMNKYKEGARTAEGILVERITRDGVILDRNGTRFLLPRQ